MVIMASTLAAAINECRHITMEELTRDTIKAVQDPAFRFEIELLNSCGHVLKTIYLENKTERAAVIRAKKEKKLFPDMAWIEILNLDTMKRTYINK